MLSFFNTFTNNSLLFFFSLKVIYSKDYAKQSAYIDFHQLVTDL